MTDPKNPDPEVSLPIPAPPVTNYAGILEQIAQSMQDVVAELRTIAAAMDKPRKW